MEPRYTVSTKLGVVLVAGILGILGYQAATRPIRSGEAYLYDRFVRPATRQVFAQELLNRDVLYTLLEKRSIGLFHVSRFSVRLPSLLFGGLYLWSVWRLARRYCGTGWGFLCAVALAGLAAIPLNCFARADGFGAALSLQILVVYCCLSFEVRKLNLSGAFLGLSVAARLEFAIPAAVLVVGILAVHRRWTDWINRVLIPAVVVASAFVVLPLSHAHAGPGTPADGTMPRSCLETLRLRTGNAKARIGASAEVEPILNFYRAEYRISTWERVDPHPGTGDFDYYLLSGADSGLIDQRHLIVLHRDGGFVLADAPAAAM